MLASSASSESPQSLVGRQRELRELQSLLGALQEGHGSLAIIGGEVGVGKTNLVSQFTKHITGKLARVFVGHCYDLETTPPYGPWLNSGILDVPGVQGSLERGRIRSAPAMTPERQQILEFLARHGPSRPSEVAGSLGMSANAATQTLRRLLAEKLVVRPAYGVYAAIPEPGAFQPFANAPRAVEGANPFLIQSLHGQHAATEAGSQQSLYQDMWDLIRTRGQGTPVVQVLEDMHWADQASIELLRYVARRISTVPILTIVTYRDDELAPEQPLYRYLPHIIREGDARRISLRRLDSSEIRSLLAHRYELDFDDETRLTRYIQRYTDGNPFFIHEVLLTMEQDLQLSRGNSGWQLTDLSGVHIPPLVQQVIDGRLEHLSEQDRRLLQIAAVIGVEVPINLLQDVSGATDEEILETMERAVDVHVLHAVSGRPVVRFTHALVREALLDSMVPLRAQRLHRRVADALFEQPAVDPDVVAHHLQQANDPRAAEWLIRGGERAVRQFAWIGAVERFQAALDLLPVSTETATQRAWLLYHIGMLSRRSDADVSLAALRAAAEIAVQIGSPILQGLSVTSIGLIRCIFGEIRLGLIEIERGVQILETLNREEINRTLLTLREESALIVRLPVADPSGQRGILIHWLAVAGRYAESIEMGNEFIRKIPEVPRGTDLINSDDYYDAYLGLGHAYNMRAMPVEAVDALNMAHKGYSEYENLPLNFLQYRLMHLVFYGMSDPVERERVERMVTTVWESHRGMSPIEIAERFRPPRLLYWYGEWDEVERISREWATRSETMSTRMVGLGLGMIARHRGMMDEASAWTNAAMNHPPEQSFGDSWCELAMQAQRLAAEISLDTGDLAEADCWIQIHRSFLNQSGARLGLAQHFLLESRYQQMLGNDHEAFVLAETSLSHATNPDQPIARLMAHRAIGYGLIARCDYNGAELHLSASYELASKCATQFERALTAHAQAVLMLATGKSAAARHKLAEARSIATALNARPLLAALSELSDSLTDPGGKQSRPDGLTPREIEILQLVAHGMTDAEIARQLFVSPRTVSGHLRSIYNKLGISSRAAATAYVFTHNLI